MQAFSTCHRVGQEPWLLMAPRPSPEWWGPEMELSEPWTSPSVLAHVSPFREHSACPHTWASSAVCPKVLFSFRVLGHSFTRPTDNCSVVRCSLECPTAPSFCSKRRWAFPSSLLTQHLPLASIRVPGHY